MTIVFTLGGIQPKASPERSLADVFEERLTLRRQVLGADYVDKVVPFTGTVSRAPTARRCTHSVPEDAGGLRTVANRVEGS